MPFSVNGEVDIQTSLTIQSQLSNGTWVDSMKFTDNVISTQVTDGDIQIAPNGSGNVYLGLLSNNDQITVGSTLNLYDNVITTTTTDGIISIVPDGNGHIKVNTLNILNDGTLENTVNNGNISIYPNGTGILRLTENIEIVKNGTSSYTELSSDLQSNVSITAANIGTGFSGRNIVMNPSGNGYFISGDVGIKENIIKGLTTSKNITIQSPYNEMEFQNNVIALRSLNGSVGPSLKFEYSLNNVNVDTLMSINSSNGGLIIKSPSFSLSFDGINSAISLDSSNNLVYSGTVSLTAPSGDALVVTSGNTRLNGGTLYVAGLLTANNGIDTNTINVNGDATISNGDLNVNGNIYKNGVAVVNSQWSYSLNLTDIYFNNNVGINNTMPAYDVDITGDLNYTGTLYHNGVPFIGSLWSQSNNDLYYVGGNIGIGVINPGSSLDVSGDINFSGTLYQNNNLFLSTQWVNGTTNKIYYDSGNVGIGLTNPVYLLDVDGDINCTGSLRVNGIQINNPWDIDNSNNLSYTAGKIGIGINNPDSNLHVYATQNTSSIIYPISIQSNTADVNVSNNNGGVGLKFIASRGTGTDQHTCSIYSQIYDGSGTTNDKWSFKFNLKNGSTMNDVMIMRSDGNIGIGISNPVTKIHVNNTDNTSTNLVTLENVSDSSVIGTAKMIVMNNLRNYNTYTQESNTHTCGTDIITVNGDSDVRYSGFTLTELSKLRVEYDYPATSNSYTSSSFCIYTNDGSGNTEKMRVTGAGNVGIGTSTPDRDFVVSKSYSSYIKAVNTGSNNYIMLGAGTSSSGTLLYSRQIDETTPVMFSINQGSLGETFVLDTSGNVGIGTTGPTAKLDIGGNTDGQVQSILTRGSDTDFQLQAINSSSSNNSGDVVSKFGLRNGTNETILFNFIRGNFGNDGSLAIVTDNAERMRISSSGSVGIGTSSPEGKLHISGGNGDCVMILEADNDNSIGTDNPAIWFRQDGGLNESAIAMDSNRLTFINNVSTGGGISFYIGTTDNTGTTSPLTGASEIMTIKPSGNVGIGTISPTQKLQVDGYQTFYNSTLLPGRNTTGSDLVPSKIILGNEYSPQIRTFYPNNVYTDGIDLEFWTGGPNIITDNTSSRLTIKAQSGNVGVGTSSPNATLDVAGSIKADHLSLGIKQYPNVGGQWLTINLNTYNAIAGPNAPEPEGGIMFSNIDTNSIFKWGYYMGVVKPSASDQSNSQRLDIGRTIDVESQISGGTIGTFIPSVTVFNNNVGIGTISPTSRLTINSGSTNNSNSENAYHGLAVTTGTSDQTIWMGYDGSADIGYINCAKTGSVMPICLQSRGGTVGIGTTNPHAMLHVAGQGRNQGALSNSGRRYFGGNVEFYNGSGVGEHGGQMSIYAWSRIVSSDLIVGHGSSTFSDRRIKANIVDVEDDICLQKLRLIKPKQYTYQDTIEKGTAPVWGFIAQEVSDVLDYAVEKMEKAIPNIYKLASVSQDGFVLTFDEPVTLEAMDNIRLQLKTFISEEHEVTVLHVINSTSVRLTESLSVEHHTGTVDGENINGKVFVYGQWVDDFHVLKKDAIFTVAVAALQEVDRRQQSDNVRILELEEEVALLKEQMAAVLAATNVIV